MHRWSLNLLVVAFVLSVIPIGAAWAQDRKSSGGTWTIKEAGITKSKSISLIEWCSSCGTSLARTPKTNARIGRIFGTVENLSEANQNLARKVLENNIGRTPPVSQRYYTKALENSYVDMLRKTTAKKSALLMTGDAASVLDGLVTAPTAWQPTDPFHARLTSERLVPSPRPTDDRPPGRAIYLVGDPARSLRCAFVVPRGRGARRARAAISG